MLRVGFGKLAVTGESYCYDYRFGSEYSGVKMFVNCGYILTVI